MQTPPRSLPNLPSTPSTADTSISLRRKTASEILASFSPKPQLKKSLSQTPSPQSHPIIMMAGRRLRDKQRPISYEISSDDENTDSQIDSSFSSPEKPSRKRVSIVDLEDEFEEITPPPTPPPRSSAAGHSLRQHGDLKLSLQAKENAYRPVRKKRKVSKRKSEAILKTSKQPAPVQPKTERNELRDLINTETARKRANFLLANKEIFLPLLPDSNFIQKLVAQRGGSSADDSVAYEVVEKQPVGVEAVMKPYQLLGLSFLVYLYKNGTSGILGDEMGLGKTLQTLSLFQYLKESRTQNGAGAENRPSLVVCPLSVLSSWIAESRKWTPGLKVLRFHGSMQERDRLKKIAIGEIDQYGNQTVRSRKRKNSRRTANGKPIIDLDSEIEGAPEERGVDLIVTTYEGFLAEQAWFKKAFVWTYVVLDEGHKIKNDLSLISKALQGLGAEYRLILTGTPLQNNLQELWALLHWLYPEVFTEKTADLFKESFNLTKGRVSTQVMDNARRLLEVIMLRRMKNSPGVNLNLPPKTEVLLYVPLSPMQRFWYVRLLTRADKGLLEELFQGAGKKEALALEQEEKDANEESNILKNKTIEDLEALDTTALGADDAAQWEESKEIMLQALQKERQDDKKSTAWKKLMNLLMQLRKCCNHPYTLPHAAPDPYYVGDHVIHASGKFIVLEKIIKELVVNQKKKVLIFSGFTQMLDCCEDFLALCGGLGEEFKYLRLDGGTGRARRNLGIRMFNKQDSAYRVMLISTRAGGLGINLATASDVIMLDQDFNPQIMLQAEARAHRIGQTNPVTVYKLCTQGTVEEQMLGRIQKKLYLSAKVTESMRDIHFASATKQKKGPGGRVVEAAEDDMPQLDTSQLMSLVRRGAQALAHPELDINEMVGWDWPTMLDRCKDKPSDVRVAQQTQSGVSIKDEDEKKWLSQIEMIESRVFQGKKHTKTRDLDNNNISHEWSRESRREGKNTTVMVDGHVVSKESMNCGMWEAVPTMAGKDPRLAEPKREKKPEVVNQDHCQVCWNGGDVVLCSGCPRSFHYACLDRDFKAKSKGKMHFYCPQHQCADCEQNTTNAGGMIYRCRWCERGYCEDCLDWQKTDLLGENLKEFELLGFPAITQAFYIKCHNCHEHHIEDRKARDFCVREEGRINKRYEKYQREQDLLVAAAEVAKESMIPPTPAETHATTIDGSGLTTPGSDEQEKTSPGSGRKRKAAPKIFGYDGVPEETMSRASTPQFKGPAALLKVSPTKRSKRLKT